MTAAPMATLRVLPILLDMRVISVSVDRERDAPRAFRRMAGVPVSPRTLKTAD
jgi:hypothetical protein